MSEVNGIFVIEVPCWYVWFSYFKGVGRIQVEVQFEKWPLESYASESWYVLATESRNEPAERQRFKQEIINLISEHVNKIKSMCGQRMFVRPSVCFELLNLCLKPNKLLTVVTSANKS